MAAVALGFKHIRIKIFLGVLLPTEGSLGLCEGKGDLQTIRASYLIKRHF